MRILASPAFANEKVNPYNALLYRATEAVRIKSVDLATDNYPASESNIMHGEAQHLSVNEYSHKKAILEKYDIIHFHWPDGYVNQRSLLKSLQRALVFTLIIFIIKLKFTKIVWTVHNVAPHDAYHPTFSRFFMRWFIHRCNGLIFMSEESKKTFFNLYKPKVDIQCAIIPHGHYRNSYHPAIDKNIAKTQLGLPQEKKVILFCGMIKPYKNIGALIQLFIQAKLTEYSLVIAGNPDSPELAESLLENKGTHANIHLFLSFIPDDKLHVYLSAADVLILPYKAILNSGALLLALSFNKPVIAPHIGAFVALQQELGKQWVYSYAADLDVTTLTDALYQLNIAERPVICPLENYDWTKLATATIIFYQQLLLDSFTPKQPLLL